MKAHSRPSHTPSCRPSRVLSYYGHPGGDNCHVSNPVATYDRATGAILEGRIRPNRVFDADWHPPAIWPDTPLPFPSFQTA